MPFTLTVTVNTVVGDRRMLCGNVTATNITGTLTIPGAVAVDAIVAFHPSQNTASLTCWFVGANVNASGVAALGQLGFSNVVSSTGNQYLLTVLYH